MRVDIERVLALQKERSEINKPPLDEIEWYQDGVKLDIPQEIIKEFEFVGLINVDFITTGFYLNGWKNG